MSKHEGRVWFERLLELRDEYRRSAETLAVMTIDEVIAFGNAGFDAAAEAETAPPGAGSPRRMCP